MMLELLKSAMQGWYLMNSHGKLTALLFLILLYLGIAKNKDRQQVLYWYTLGMTAICTIPVTAIFCMLYQTKFYDYQWIWTYVPMTMMIAYGGVCFWKYCRENTACGKVHRGAILFAALVLLLFCGNMGNRVNSTQKGISEGVETKVILDEMVPVGTDACFWGPRELMESAREVRGDLKLFYGRNMWDKALNAYSYDIYSEAVELCYQWMSELELIADTEAFEKTQAYDHETLHAYIREARARGVTIICIPAHIPAALIDYLEEDCGIELTQCRCTEHYLYGNLVVENAGIMRNVG